jgi:eukaryotic-like serine/threonine-protein kinase
MEISLGPGSVIAGRYHLTAQLGQGGMGSVWRAEHLTLRSPVAVKLIDPEIAGRRETLERFQAEAQAAAALRSPHVVQILDYGVDGAVPYIVMEMLEGESLADRLLRVGRLTPADASRVVTHVARALARAHEAGIVHRDLKPDNVFLVRNDDHDVAKVLDFGIAKTANPAGLMSGKGPTRTGSILGTPSYMSPEQAQGNKTLDGRSDVWSLGVIAFECVVGRVPFDGEALGDILLKICMHPLPIPSQVGPVPPGFDAWFTRACCREVGQRFQTAKELAEALRAVLLPDERVSSSNSSPSLMPRSSDPSVVGMATVALAPAAFGPDGVASTLRAGGTPAVPGTTMPGMSLATTPGAKRAVGVYVAAALALVVLGAAGTWFVVAGGARPRPPVGATAMLAAGSIAAPTPPTPPAAATPGGPAVAPGSAISAAPPPTVEPASPAPDPGAGATLKAHTAAPQGAKPPTPTPPPAALPPAPHPPQPPPAHPGPPAQPASGDRLGF